MSPERLKNLSTEERDRLEKIADAMFNLRFMFWSLRHQNRVDDPHDLTEPEFVVLDTLSRKEICTVGELQQALSVRPAQMSRIIRTLETKSKAALVRCAINPQDKRRVDVSITDLGKKAHKAYRDYRMLMNMSLLKNLSESEQIEIIRLVNRFHQIMSEQLGVRQPAEKI